MNVERCDTSISTDELLDSQRIGGSSTLDLLTVTQRVGAYISETPGQRAAPTDLLPQEETDPHDAAQQLNAFRVLRNEV